MNQRQEKAINLRAIDGYNCAQAVALTYCDYVNLDPTTAYKCIEAFGLGMGRMQGVCGALCGAIMIMSYDLSSGEIQPGGKRTKHETYNVIYPYVEKFRDMCGALYCKDLKDPKSDHFTPCEVSIANACTLLDEYLNITG